MRSLLSKLWADDNGAIVSAEIVLVLTILVLGLIPGLVALRNTTNAALATIGNELLSLQVGYSFASFSIVSGNTTIAFVQGAQFVNTGAVILSSSNTPTGATVSATAVSPAP